MLSEGFTTERLFALVLAIPALVAALTVHEFAHAWTAVKKGDDTPQRDGRLTLDPMAHLDPFGSLFFMFAWFYGMGIGWAKPVMVNHRNLEDPRRDSVLVAIAGPISNLIQIPIWMLLLFIWNVVALKMGWSFNDGVGSPGYIGYTICQNGILINMLLAAFNMIPIPPLDGHWVLEGLGPPFVTDFYDMIRPYAFMILILLVSFTPLLSIALTPFMIFAYQLVFWTTDASLSIAGPLISAGL